jgi:glycosyltransferase involved in cell wall biosynthesis
MKILQINKFHFLKGGSERYVFSLSELLCADGHEVLHFSMQHPENVPDKDADLFVSYMDMHRFHPLHILKFFYNYEAVRKLRQLIRRERPDIAHLHNIAHQLTPAIIRVLKKEGIPVVMTLHDYKLVCPNSQLYNKTGNCERCRGGKYYNCLRYSCLHNSRALSFLGMLEAYLNRLITDYYNEVDFFIAPSKYMKEAMIRFGLPAEKLCVIYNFLSAEWLSKPSATSQSDPYLLYYGRLSEEKGVSDLIAAMERVTDRALKLIIAGTGPQSQSLADIIKEKGLVDRVSLAGFVKGAELDSLIGGALATVMPSRWPENMPYSLLEAMALGKINIVAKVGGLPEMIEEGVNGFLFSPGNITELAEKIDYLASIDINKRVGLEKKARAKAQEMNGKAHLAELLEKYQHLLKINS